MRSPLDGRGQFYARMRPKQLGRTDWVYTLTGNVTAWRRYTEYFVEGWEPNTTCLDVPVQPYDSSGRAKAMRDTTNPFRIPPSR